MKSDEKGWAARRENAKQSQKCWKHWMGILGLLGLGRSGTCPTGAKNYEQSQISFSYTIA
jgi:hypothetical protein